MTRVPTIPKKKLLNAAGAPMQTPFTNKPPSDKWRENPEMKGQYARAHGALFFVVQAVPPTHAGLIVMNAATKKTSTAMFKTPEEAYEFAEIVLTSMDYELVVETANKPDTKILALLAHAVDVAEHEGHLSDKHMTDEVRAYIRSLDPRNSVATVMHSQGKQNPE